MSSQEGGTRSHNSPAEKNSNNIGPLAEELLELISVKECQRGCQPCGTSQRSKKVPKRCSYYPLRQCKKENTVTGGGQSVQIQRALLQDTGGASKAVGCRAAGDNQGPGFTVYAN